VDPSVAIADVDREGPDQILAAVAVIQRPGAEEQGDRGVDRGLGPGLIEE
jgi:hypothetical protein